MAAASFHSEHPCISCELDDAGLALVRIRRPEKRNALTLSMWRALTDIFAGASEDPSCRCVILTGDGGHFSAGADISEFSENRADAQAGLEYDEVCDRTTLAIRNCHRPVIAAMSGVAVGGGLGLALACDFRLADKSVRAGIPAGRLGLVYSVLDCSLLAYRLGETRAKEVLFTGSIYGSEDAARLGLVDRVAEDALEAARDLAGSIVRNAPLSVAGNKAILNAVTDGTAARRDAELKDLIARAFESEDYAEGRRAFMERRPPVFRGH